MVKTGATTQLRTYIYQALHACEYKITDYRMKSATRIFLVWLNEALGDSLAKDKNVLTNQSQVFLKNPVHLSNPISQLFYNP
jgi:hypothetical protein